MIRSARPLALALAVALAVASIGPGARAVVAAEDEPLPSDLDPGIDRGDLPDRAGAQGPLAVFAKIEKAWTEEDVDGLVALLDPDEKVRLAFEHGGPRGGWFNRDQAYFLLKDMFEYLETERFRFERYWNLESNGRSPYAVAVREYRMSDGIPRTDQVFLALRQGDGAWTVGEIRTVDR